MFPALVTALSSFACLGFLVFLGVGIAFGRIFEEGFAAGQDRAFREVIFTEFPIIAVKLFCDPRV